MTRGHCAAAATGRVPVQSRGPVTDEAVSEAVGDAGYEVVPASPGPGAEHSSGHDVAALPLAAAGLPDPVLAGAAMAFSSVFVVSDSLRLRRFRTADGAAPAGAGPAPAADAARDTPRETTPAR
ncbi:hypothetical protein [Geodermatophilus sp. SYSU D00684]